ncbi:sialidase family protein [Acinetobacter radioresistens]|uniref:sialidase family protein n=1 Tax=Acinetobacter radioresistens TaxID=40216 RepID=UPI002FCDA0FC
MPLPNILEFIGTNISQRKFQEAQEKLLNYLGIEVPTKTELNSEISKVNSAITPKADKVYVDNALTGFTNGAAKFYPTISAAQADIANISVKDKVEVGEAEFGGVWYKATVGSTYLTKSAYDPLTQAKGYAGLSEIKAKQYADATKTNKSTADAVGETNVIAVIASANDKTLAHFDENADFYLAGEPESVQKQLERLPAQSSALKVAYSLDDSNGQSLLIVLEDGSTFLAGDEISLQKQLVSAKGLVKLLNVSSTLPEDDSGKINQLLIEHGDSAEISRYSRIDSAFAETVKSTKRIPSIIKTSYGLLFLYCEQIPPYDGDNQGARLCKRYVNLDSAGRIKSISDKVILESPSVNTGLVKHQMLGRTKTGRIVMIYDVRETTTTPYRNYVRFSDDDGLTFTAPVELSKPASLSGISVVTGSTGAIAVLSTGRLVCPFYYNNNVICAYSDDNGVTWAWGANLSGGAEATNESAITVDENDVLYLTVRTQNQYKKFIYTSVDGGQTLVSAGLRDDLPSSICASTILYDQDNGVMLHGTPTYPSMNIRKRYRIKVSLDKTATFPINVKLFDDELYVGYSQLTSLGNGLYALVYEGDAAATGVNINENVSLLIFNLNGVLSNVTYS